MTRPPSSRTAAALFVALALSGPATADPERAITKENFDRTIAPLLTRRCLDCHGGAKPKGGLDLSRKQKALAGGKSGVAVVPGKPSASLLWEQVDAGSMPPKKPLTDDEKALLKAWIEAGAPWGGDPIDPFRATTDKRAGADWWSLQPVARPAPPAVKDASSVRNLIDRFILQRLEARGLKPSAPADRRTLIRRLSFDLLGLPPAPEDVAAFEADVSPDAYERLVERLLASPQYGVRWARHWLDVVRFGESNGFEHDEFRPNAWPYRDWVVRALNADLPYDEFARLQLAGDVLRPGDPEALKATGFLVAGAYDSVGQTQQSAAMRRVVRQDELEDVVGTVGQTFLGLTVHCARCHDHKFDPVRQEEYYRLTAALGGVRHGERDLPRSPAEVAAARQRLAALTKELTDLEAPARTGLLAGRARQPLTPPRPLARWDFAKGMTDAVGSLHATLQGSARLVPDGLKVDGHGHAETTPLAKELRAKTLEAWVTLDNLEQRGGGVIGVQTRDGAPFDALVFGEREPGRWMAGSEGFVRTQSFEGGAEVEAHRKPVHVALVYAEDGTITGYRNGQPYGRPYKTELQAFGAGQARVVFGLRHAPAGGDRLLAGTIHRAALYDRALTPAEVAASAGGASDFLADEEIGARLSPEKRAERRRLQARVAEQHALVSGPGPKVYAVMPRQPEAARLLARGNTQQPGALLSAGGVEALRGVHADFGLSPDAPEGEARRRFASWASDAKNPLFARVIANRVWHYHFGVGLVDTPNDFGFNGGRPSHPELLDGLAAELIDSGWSLKHLHRLLVTSATYRQSSRPDEAALKVDAGNRLLWRKSPLRLEAEAARDAMIRVTGRLNETMGGPGFQEYRITRAPGTVTNTFTPVEAAGDEFDRRTLYRTWARGGRSGLLDAFDCPDPSTTAPSRAVTTTPLQALAMLNNAQVLRNAERFAGRVRREAGEDAGKQVERAYLLAYGRAPDAEERERAKGVVERHGLGVLTRAIFNSNEFLYID